MSTVASLDGRNVKAQARFREFAKIYEDRGNSRPLFQFCCFSYAYVGGYIHICAHVCIKKNCVGLYAHVCQTWRDFTMLSCYFEYTLEISIYLFLELHSTYFLAGWLDVMLRHAKDDLHI